jgi:hypothetical protein
MGGAGGGKARRASAAAGGAADAAALEAARLQLFKDAHYVHARPPPPQGTSSFKVGMDNAHTVCTLANTGATGGREVNASGLTRA